MESGDVDIDVLELGDRAAGWLLRDEPGQAYSGLPARAWPAALGCYAKCAAALGARNVPGKWRPARGEDGMRTGTRPACKPEAGPGGEG